MTVVQIIRFSMPGSSGSRPRLESLCKESAHENKEQTDKRRLSVQF